MNTNEGLRRVRLLGTRIMLFGALAVIAFWILLSALNGGSESRPIDSPPKVAGL